MIICSKCKKKFISENKWDDHPCMVEAMSMSNEDLLDSLYKSGGCSKEFYIKELKEKVEEAEAQLFVDLKAAFYGDESDDEFYHASKNRYEKLLEKLKRCE